MRKTSLDAYNSIRENGILSRARFLVYSNLFESGPLTANELAEKMKVRVKGSVCARLTELRDMGCVEEIKEIKCPISGLKTILWDVNDRIPVRLKREKPRVVYLELGLFGSVLKYSDSPFEGAFKFKEII